jgi:glutathione S-transferase
MILIGQYDSPFVRRVAVALRFYAIDYEHWPWSTFGDADRLAAYNPLRRVPTLILDSEDVLIESTAILDHLDEVAGPDRALIARAGSERQAVLRICALATGLCDKLVGLIYERVLHESVSAAWVERCETQVVAVLDALETDRSARGSHFWFGERITHADIAATCAMRFLREAHSETFDIGRWPSLVAQADRCEALDIFQTVIQPFIPPG